MFFPQCFLCYFELFFLPSGPKQQVLYAGELRAKDERVQEVGEQRQKSMCDTENCCVCLMAGLIINV